MSAGDHPPTTEEAAALAALRALAARPARRAWSDRRRTVWGGGRDGRGAGPTGGAVR